MVAKMKVRIPVLMTLLMMLILIVANSADAQYKGRSKKNKTKLSVSEIFRTLKQGQWVQLEGVLQKDKTVLCTKVKILTGDFQDDDWEIAGIVERIDFKKKEFRLSGIQIQVQDDAEYENDEGTFKNFSDLKRGMLVEVEGISLKNGAFLAAEIEDKSAELKEDPEKKYEIEIEGKVEKLNAKKRTITISGVVFQLTEQTKAKSVIE